MAAKTRITNEQYERMALGDGPKWELWDGLPREKPGGTAAQNSLAGDLTYILMSQLDWSAYHVRSNGGRLRLRPATYVVPDLFVFPQSYLTAHLRRDDVLEVYDKPVPLTVEVWSGLSGDAYVAAKIAVYRERGDSEIWRLHPHERTLTAWRRQPDGSYTESVHHEGFITPIALPDVTIDLDRLFTA